MVKRCICITALFLLVFVMVSDVFAQSSNEELQAKLNEVRAQKARITESYNAELAKVNRETDADLVEIKKEFHAKRDKRTNESNAKKKELLDNYKSQTRPLEVEEKGIIEKIVPKSMNFAKPKAK